MARNVVQEMKTQIKENEPVEVPVNKDSKLYQQTFHDRFSDLFACSIESAAISGVQSALHNYEFYKRSDKNGIQVIKDTLVDSLIGSWENTKWAAVMSSSALQEASFIGLLADGTMAFFFERKSIKESLRQAGKGAILAGMVVIMVGTITNTKTVVPTVKLTETITNIISDYTKGRIDKRECIMTITQNTGTTIGSLLGFTAGATIGGTIAGFFGPIAPIGRILGGVFGSIIGAGVGYGFGMKFGEFVSWLFNANDPIVEAYKLFGVPPNCTDRELTLVYHQICLRNHPDKHQNERLQYEDIMKEINIAYYLLQNERKKIFIILYILRER